MHERLLLVADERGELTTYADLRGVAVSACNDMAVDADGRAYITQLGYDLFAGEAPRKAAIIVVEPDGTVHEADGGDYAGANGIVVSPDGRTVVTAENDGSVLTALDRAPDGTLSARRVIATTPWRPDGICTDAGGGVWAAMPGSGFVARYADGEATHLIEVPVAEGYASSIAIGGADGRTLLMTVGREVYDWAKSRAEGLGTLWTAPAPYPAPQADA